MVSEDWADRFCMRQQDGDIFEKCRDEELLERLDRMFIKWEAEIAAERENQNKKGYFSDKLENEITSYAFYVVCNLIFIYENDKYPEVNSGNIEGWKRLFGHRHFAYQLYKLADRLEDREQGDEKPEDETMERLLNILSDSVNLRILYLALAEYFALYYGTFSDNELAIRMICKYYPDKLEFSDEDQDKIVEGLKQHILTAGTNRDTGFAYNGISLIEQWINRLPVPLVLLLLGQYLRYQIDNQVNRHQIHSIIMKSRMKAREQQLYKFLFLDSLMFMKCIEPLLSRKWAGEGLSGYTGNSLASCVDPRMVFAQKDGQDYAWWGYEKSDGEIRRSLHVGQKVFVEISLRFGESSLQISCKSRFDQLGFDLSDWLLNQYESNETTEILERLLGIGNEEGDMRKFLFSHVYLNRYRGISGQQLSFDHCCCYDPDTKRLQIGTEEHPDFSGFYGQQVHSLSCIVGKNGMGKTGILDFLRDSFFRLLEELDAPWTKYMNGVFKIQDYHSPGLNRDMEFLIVFRLGEKFYFFTNIEGLNYNAAQIRPFPKNMMLSNQESSKIVYFSSKIDGNMAMWKRGGQGGQSAESRWHHSFEDSGNVDYSSAASYFNRINSKGDASYVNQDLCYQLAFLDVHSNDKLKRLLGWDLKKEDLLLIMDESKSPEPLGQWICGNLGGWLKEKDEEDIRQIFRNPAARIGHFSSGQFSKLDFLSKLYWSLSGYERCHKAFEAAVGMNSFKITDSLQPGETAILFIDEGELYYHPEWQRRYLDTLLYMIRRYGTEVTVQIVITTNSPFIISDMLEWDVTYLPAVERETAGSTFGQNIHTLLTSNFYMDATIGEVSRKCIGGLLRLLCGPEYRQSQAAKAATDWINYFLGRMNTPGQRLDERQARNFLTMFINQIGETIYREELLELLDICWEPVDKKARLDDMLREQERLAQQIKELEQELGGENR